MFEILHPYRIEIKIYFVDAAIYNHVQTNRNNACRQTIET